MKKGGPFFFNRGFGTALLCLSLCCAAGCSKKKARGLPDSRPTRTISETPSQEGWTSSITLTRTGKLQAVIWYGHMAEFEDQGLTRFDQGITIDFYDADGGHTSRLTSDRGLYYKNSEEVIGEGRVVVVADTGITLQTEKMRWNPQTQLILSNEPVKVTTQTGDSLFGLGFQSKADLSRWIILKPRGTTQRKVDLKSIESAAGGDTTSKRP
jgi:LPS export ABC transporter protein LptC